MLNNDAEILIIDDSKVARMVLKRILNGLGYNNIIEAVDGPDGITRYAEEEPSLIFLDIVMPGMTGDEVLANIRALDEKTPVVILSSASSEVQIGICQQIGISDFIKKPLTLDAGPGKIKSTLDKI
ncbi:MAG: response regulator [Holosporales bacterium]|jgi:two-component system chemotaxis response regulator CheY|nr:response regulator [Holosporales bacterium]